MIRSRMKILPGNKSVTNASSFAEAVFMSHKYDVCTVLNTNKKWEETTLTNPKDIGGMLLIILKLKSVWVLATKREETLNTTQ